MTTLVTTINNNEWSLILSGKGIIQLKTRGHIHIHIGTAAPAIDAKTFHTAARTDNIDFSYSGTENVYCMNGAPGEIVLTHTNCV